ncbi:MAG: amidophosphoribosyltransferase [Ichthyobacteriaceae bacterium]|nr:amidophosphoribosyltransferase [Ichthyobacteriaceae bacterium]
MSEPIKHECGIAMVRLLKPISYYKEKYGSAFYGLNKMYLMMEKQHNRGQDGAGIANIKFDVPAGKRYISRVRSNDSSPIQDVFARINGKLNLLMEENKDKVNDMEWVKNDLPFSGELFLGHVRYGTFGKNSIENVHPFLRQNNWMSRNLIVAGNFNMTNTSELFQSLIDLGQHPKEQADTVTIMEKIGHFLDEEVEKLYYMHKANGVSKKDAAPLIERDLDLEDILKRAAPRWDGGYAMAGMLGHGDAFVLRDPWGIRPAFYYADDEVVAVASERAVIQTTFNVSFDDVKELERGKALIIKKNGKISLPQVIEKQRNQACSFERIYFSRGSDAEIYQERKELGRQLIPAIIDAVDGDLKNTVFSYIPNTAETAFYGMVDGIETYMDNQKQKQILELGTDVTPEKLEEIFTQKPRVEKIAVKDAKLRTFITDDDSRDDLVAHVYDVTYGSVRENDNLVIIDDSIVRGTTLKQSIIRILDRLNPKKIVVVSSAPQIRYPDCYGIDMAKLEDFIAFKATVELLKDTKQEAILDNIYKKSKAQVGKTDADIVNYVTEMFDPFTDQQISDKIAEMLKTKTINAEIKVIYQTVSDLHKACPKSPGDWYFTGDYPTPGGNRVVNNAFINFMEGNNKRAY